MTNNNASGGKRHAGRFLRSGVLKSSAAAIAVAFTVGYVALPSAAQAQQFRFNAVTIEGNQRIEPSTILSYAGIARGASVSGADLNSAYQRILGSGLFETVEIEPRGNRLVIKVTEFPTINRINFEGNRRIKDDALEAVVQSQARRVFNPTTAERDASQIAEAYSVQGRVTATVNPRIIRRSDNRVDLVFEIFEGGLTEIERVGFVGNKVYSDGRLRRVLETKQAGLLRAFVKKDTFVPDRIEFDKQVLSDFYFSRGYVDFRTTGVNAELARERDGYFLTFNVEEGQQFKFGAITTVSEIAEADELEFQAALKIRPGVVYSPSLVENSIARLERLAIKKGLNFVRVEPRITRNDRDLTLDVEFALTRGPRIFVERIDIEGNATTLDRVVRNQFKIVEGDPFNPREIRESAERIRALAYFADADVQAREGSAPDQVVVDVDLEETTTGSLTFGGTYSTTNGPGAVISYREQNFLGRGQQLNFAITTGTDNREYTLGFAEPAFLGRDLRFGLNLSFVETDNANASYDTTLGTFRPSFEFPVSENGRVQLRYTLGFSEMTDLTSTAGALVTAEAARGQEWSSALGYTYSYDTRRTGLNPNAGVLLEFGQDFSGLGGDNQYIKTTAKAIAQTKILNEEVTLRASLEGGMLNYIQGSSRSTDRFFLGSSVMRGFAADGIGPREVSGTTINDALGGNMFAVARFEAEFPLGLPEEYGIAGGLFYDIGSLWSLDSTNANVINEGFAARQVIGASIFWDTPVGPLRFNFSKALSKQVGDEEQTFDLSISTEF